MELKNFEVNPFGENTYILWDCTTKEAAIVDPGMSDAHETSEVERFITSNKLHLKYILLTHVHIDHTFGIPAIKSMHEVPVLAHKSDAPLGLTRQQQADMFHLKMKLEPLTPDRFIDETAELSLGTEKIQVIATPGHSLGGLCYYVPQSHFILTGDTLFRGSVGRTDFIGGSQRQLINSIRTKLLTLPPETIVYPGHGPATTLAQEEAGNPFI